MAFFERSEAEVRGQAPPILCLLELKNVRTPWVLSIKYPLAISFPARLVGQRFKMMLKINSDCLLNKILSMFSIPSF